MTIAIKWNIAANGHAVGDEEFVQDNDEFVKALIEHGRVSVVWEDLPAAEDKPEVVAEPQEQPTLEAVGEPEAHTE